MRRGQSQKSTGTPTGYRWVETLDGGKTLFSEAFNETFHSLAGAVGETKAYFIEGTNLVERMKAKLNPFTIFEVGFGMGLGLEAVMASLENTELKQPWTYISSEIDEKLFLFVVENNPLLKQINFQVVQEFHGGKVYSGMMNEQVTVKVIIGDIYQLIGQIDERTVDVVFHDPFSFKRCPDLWSVQFFQKIKNILRPEGILATYSASAQTRKSMVEAGLFIQKGPQFGLKKSSTQAFNLEWVEENENDYSFALYEEIKRSKMIAYQGISF